LIKSVKIQYVRAFQNPKTETKSYEMLLNTVMEPTNAYKVPV